MENKKKQNMMNKIENLVNAIVFEAKNRGLSPTVWRNHKPRGSFELQVNRDPDDESVNVETIYYEFPKVRYISTFGKKDHQRVINELSLILNSIKEIPCLMLYYCPSTT